MKQVILILIFSIISILNCKKDKVTFQPELSLLVLGGGFYKNIYLKPGDRESTIGDLTKIDPLKISVISKDKYKTTDGDEAVFFEIKCPNEIKECKEKSAYIDDSYLVKNPEELTPDSEVDSSAMLMLVSSDEIKIATETRDWFNSPDKIEVTKFHIPTLFYFVSRLSQVEKSVALIRLGWFFELVENPSLIKGNAIETFAASYAQLRKKTPLKLEKSIQEYFVKPKKERIKTFVSEFPFLGSLDTLNSISLQLYNIPGLTSLIFKEYFNQELSTIDTNRLYYREYLTKEGKLVSKNEYYNNYEEKVGKSYKYIYSTDKLEDFSNKVSEYKINLEKLKSDPILWASWKLEIPENLSNDITIEATLFDGNGSIKGNEKYIVQSVVIWPNPNREEVDFVISISVNNKNEEILVSQNELPSYMTKINDSILKSFNSNKSSFKDLFEQNKYEEALHQIALQQGKINFNHKTGYYEAVTKIDTLDKNYWLAFDLFRFSQLVGGSRDVYQGSNSVNPAIIPIESSCESATIDWRQPKGEVYASITGRSCGRIDQKKLDIPLKEELCFKMNDSNYFTISSSFNKDKSTIKNDLEFSGDKCNLIMKHLLSKN